MTNEQLKADLNLLVQLGASRLYWDGAARQTQEWECIDREVAEVQARIMTHFAATEAPVWVSVTSCYDQDTAFQPHVVWTAIDSRGQMFVQRELQGAAWVQMDSPPAVVGDGEGE